LSLSIECVVRQQGDRFGLDTGESEDPFVVAVQIPTHHIPVLVGHKYGPWPQSSIDDLITANGAVAKADRCLFAGCRHDVCGEGLSRGKLCADEWRTGRLACCHTSQRSVDGIFNWGLHPQGTRLV